MPAVRLVMAASTEDGGGSPLSGCYLLVVLSEPHRADHRPLILQRVIKGLSSWDQRQCGVDLGQELQALIDANPEGEQFKFGERLIQFATENVVAEILVNPQVYTFQQCLKNMLSSFTRHRHLIHAGYVFSGNGSWILQDGTFSGSDLLDALRETDVQRVNRAYESSLSVHIHCPEEGIWRSEALLKDPVFVTSKVQMNPPDRDAAPVQLAAFREYLSGFLTPASLEDLLSPSDVVGNIRFSRPTLYVFPGGQGDAAMFGINGFNILFDGGFSRRACCWNFVRHLDRLDAVLMSRLYNGNLMGMSAMLQRKVDNATYPQMGHFFANLVDQKLSADVDKDADPLLVNTQLEAQRLLENLKALSLKPTPCLRENSGDPINLYHKVGHGRLDLYVLNPQKDSNEMQAFLKSWTDGPDQSRVTLRVKGREFPVANLVSICCLLVWVPDDRHDTVTRLLFPGSTPQQKIFDGLDRLKHLDFMKTPVCYVKSLGVKKHKTLDTLLKSGTKAPTAGTRAERIERVEVEQKRRVRSTSRQTRNGDATDAARKSDRGDKELLTEIKAKKQEANRERAERVPAAKPKPKPEKADLPKESRPTAVSRPKKTKPPKDDNKQAEDSSDGKNGSSTSLPKDEKEATPVKAKKDVSNKMMVEEKKVSRTTTKPKPTKPETKTKAVESKVVSKVTDTKTTKIGETKKAPEKGKARQEPKVEKPTGARSRTKPPPSPKHVRSIKPKSAQAIRPPATSTPKAMSSQEREVSTMQGTGDIEEVTMAGDMLTVTKVTTEVQRFIEEVQEGDSLEQISGDFSREIETDSLELRKVDEKVDSLKQSPTTEDSKDLRQSSEEVLRRTDIEEAVLLRASSEQKSPPQPSEEPLKLSYLERASTQKKDAVKTPDEVAELPEHEALELSEHDVQHLRTTEPVRSTDDIHRVMTTSHEPPTEEDTEKEKESVAEEKLTSPKGEKDEFNRRTKDSSPEEPQTEELPSHDAGGETRESLSQSPGYVEAGELSPKNSRQLDDVYVSPRREIYPIGEPYVESGVEAETRYGTVQRERAEMVMLASSTTTPSPSSPARDRWTTEAPHLPSVDERSLEEAVPRDGSTASGVTELSTVKIEDLYGDADKETPETQTDVKEDDKREETDLGYNLKDDLKTSATTLKKELEVADKMVHQTPDVYTESENLAEQKDHGEDKVEDGRRRTAAKDIYSLSDSKEKVSQDDHDKINAFLGEQASLVQEQSEHSELITAAYSALDTSQTHITYPGDHPSDKEEVYQVVCDDKKLKESFQSTDTSEKPALLEPRDSRDTQDDNSQISAFLQKQASLVQTPTVPSETTAIESPKLAKTSNIPSVSQDKVTYDRTHIASGTDLHSSVADLKDLQEPKKLDVDNQVEDSSKPSPGELDKRQEEVPGSKVSDEPSSLPKEKVQSRDPELSLRERLSETETSTSPETQVSSRSADSKDEKESKKPTESDEEHMSLDLKISEFPQANEDQVSVFMKEQASLVQDQTKTKEHTPPTYPAHEIPSKPESVTRDLQDEGKSYEETDVAGKQSPDVVKSLKDPVDLHVHHLPEDTTKVSPSKSVEGVKHDVQSKQVELTAVSSIDEKSPMKEDISETVECVQTALKSSEKSIVLVDDLAEMQKLQKQKVSEHQAPLVSGTSQTTSHEDEQVDAFLQQQASLPQAQSSDASKTQLESQPTEGSTPPQLIERVFVETMSVKDESDTAKTDQDVYPVEKADGYVKPAEFDTSVTFKAVDTIVGDAHIEAPVKPVERSPSKAQEEKDSLPGQQVIITEKHQEEKPAATEANFQQVEKKIMSSEKAALESHQKEIIETVQSSTTTSLDTSITSASSMERTVESIDLDDKQQERKVSTFMTEPAEAVKEITETPMSTAVEVTPSPEGLTRASGKLILEHAGVDRALVSDDHASKQNIEKDSADDEVHAVPPPTKEAAADAAVKTSPKGRDDDEKKYAAGESTSISTPTASTTDDKGETPVPTKTEDTPKPEAITDLRGSVSDIDKPIEQVSLEPSAPVEDYRLDDKTNVDAFLAEQAELVKESHPDVPVCSELAVDTHAPTIVSESQDNAQINRFLAEQADLTKGEKPGGKAELEDIRDVLGGTGQEPELVEKDSVVARALQSQTDSQHIDSDKAKNEFIEVKKILSDVAVPDHEISAKSVPSDSKNEVGDAYNAAVSTFVISDKEEKSPAGHDVMGHVEVPSEKTVVEKELKRHEEETKVTHQTYSLQQPEETVDSTATTRQKSPEQSKSVTDKIPIQEDIPREEPKTDADITVDESASTRQIDETLHRVDTTSESTVVGGPESPERTFLREQAELVKGKDAVQENVFAKETKQSSYSAATPSPESPEQVFLREQAELVRDKASILKDSLEKEIKQDAGISVDETLSTKHLHETAQDAKKASSSDDTTRSKSPEKAFQRDQTGLAKDQTEIPQDTLSEETKTHAGITIDETIATKQYDEAHQNTVQTSASTVTIRSESPEGAFLREQAELVKEKNAVEEDVLVKETKPELDSTATTKPVSPEKAFRSVQPELVEDKAAIKEHISGEEVKSDAGVTIVEAISSKQVHETVQRAEKASSSDVTIRPESPEKTFPRDKAGLTKDQTDIPEDLQSEQIKPHAGITIDETFDTKQSDGTLQKTAPTSDSTVVVRSDSPERVFLREQAELVKEKFADEKDVFVKETKYMSDSTVTTRSESPETIFLREQAELVKDKAVIHEGETEKEIKPDAGITFDEMISTRQVDDAKKTDPISDSIVTIRSESPERAFLREQAELVKEKDGAQEDEFVKETKPALDRTTATGPKASEKTILSEQPVLEKDKDAIKKGTPGKESKPDADITIEETISTKQVDEAPQKTDQTSDSTVTIRSESPERAFLREQAELVKDTAAIKEGVPEDATKPDSSITIDKTIFAKQTDDIVQKPDEATACDVALTPTSPEKASQRDQAVLTKDENEIYEDTPSKETKRHAGTTVDETISTKQNDEHLRKTAQTSEGTVTIRSESPEGAFLTEQAELVKEKYAVEEDVIVRETKPVFDSTTTTGPESPEKGFQREQPELVKDKDVIKEVVPGKEAKPDAGITIDETIFTRQVDDAVQKTDQTSDSPVTIRPESPEKAFLRQQADLVKEQTAKQGDVQYKDMQPDADDAVHETTSVKQSRDTVSVQEVETSQSQTRSVTRVSSSSLHQMTSSLVDSESSEAQQPSSLTESATSEVSVTSIPSTKTSYIIEEYEVISPRRRQQYEDVEEIVTYSPKTRSRKVSEMSAVSSSEDQLPLTSDEHVSVKKLSQETSSLMRNTAGITVEDLKPISVRVAEDKVEDTHSKKTFGDVEEIHEEVVSVQTAHASYAEPPKRDDLVSTLAESPARSSAGIDDLVSQISTTEAYAEKPIKDTIAGIEDQVMSVQKSYGSYAQPPVRAETVSTVTATSERRDVDEDDLMSQILSGKDIATGIVSSTKPKDSVIRSEDTGEPATEGKSTVERLAKDKAKPDQEDVKETISSLDDRMVCGGDDVSLPHKLSAHPEFDHCNLSPTSAQAEIEDTLLQIGAGLIAKSSSYEALASEAGKLDEKPVEAKASAKHVEKDLDSLLGQIRTYEDMMSTQSDARKETLSHHTDVPSAKIHHKPSEDLTSKLEELGSSVDKIMKVKPDKIKDGNVCIGEDDGTDYAMDAEGPITCKTIADLGPIAGKDDKPSKDASSVGDTLDKRLGDKPSGEDKHHAEAPKAMTDTEKGEPETKNISAKSPEKTLQKGIPAEAAISDTPKDASQTDVSWLDEQIAEVAEKTHPTSKHIAAYPATTAKSPRRKIVDSPDLSDDDLLTDEAKAKIDVCADSAKSSPEKKTTSVSKPASTKDEAHSDDSKVVTSTSDEKAATAPVDDINLVKTAPDDGSAPAKDTSPPEPQPIVVKDESRHVEQKGSAREQSTDQTSGEMGWTGAETPAEKMPVSVREYEASLKSVEAAVISDVSVSKDHESEGPERATEASPAQMDDIDARSFKPSEVSSQFLKTEDSMNGNASSCGDSDGAVIHELMDAGGILSAFVPGVAERFEDLHHDEHAASAPSDADPGPAKQADAAPSGAVAGVASVEESISPTASRSVERRDQGEGLGAARDVVDSADGSAMGWVAQPVHDEETPQVVKVTDTAMEIESKGTSRRDSVESTIVGSKIDSVDGTSKKASDVAAPGVIKITETALVTQDVGGGKQGKYQVEKPDEMEVMDVIIPKPAAQGLQTELDKTSTVKAPASDSQEADRTSHESTADHLSHLTHDAFEAAESEAEKVVSTISTRLSSLAESAGTELGINTQASTMDESSTTELLSTTATSSGKDAEKPTEESSASHVSHGIHDALVSAEEQAEKAASSMSTTLYSLVESAGTGLGLTTQTEVIEPPKTAASLGGGEAAVPKTTAEATQESTVSHLGYLAHDALVAVESDAEKAVSLISATVSSLAESTGLTTHTDGTDRSPEAPMKDKKTTDQSKDTTKTPKESTASDLEHVVHDTKAAAEPEAEKVASTIPKTQFALPSEKSPTSDAHTAASRSQSVPAPTPPVEAAREIARQASAGEMLASAAEPQGTTECSSTLNLHELADSFSNGITTTSKTVETKVSGIMGTVKATLSAGSEVVQEAAESAVEAAKKSSADVSDEVKQEVKEIEKDAEESADSVKEGAAHTVSSVSQYIAEASAKIEDFMSGRSKPESADDLLNEPAADTTKTDSAKTTDDPDVAARFMDKSESIFQTNEEIMSGERAEEKPSGLQGQLQSLRQDIKEAATDAGHTVEETVSSVHGYVTGGLTSPDKTQSTTEKDQTATGEISSTTSKSSDTKSDEQFSDSPQRIAPTSATEVSDKDINDGSGNFASIHSTIGSVLQTAGQILSAEAVPAAAEQLDKQMVSDESTDKPTTIPTEAASGATVAHTEQKHPQDEDSVQSLASQALEAVSTVASAVVDTTSTGAERVGDSFWKTSSAATDGKDQAADDVEGSIQQVMNEAKKSVGKTIEDTGKDVKEKVKEAQDAINKSADDLRKAIEAEHVQKLSKDLTEGTADAIKTAEEMVDRVTSAAQEKAADADAALAARKESTETAIQAGIGSLASGVQEVRDEGEIKAEAGKQLIRDVASSVEDKGASALSSADQSMGQATAKIASATDSVKGTVLDSTKDLKQRVETTTKKADDLLKDGAQEVSQQVLSTAKSADETLRVELKDLSETIDGLTETAKDVISDETKRFREDVESASKATEHSLSSTLSSAKANIASALTGAEKAVEDAHQETKKEIEEIIESAHATVTEKIDDTRRDAEKTAEMSKDALKTAAKDRENQAEEMSGSLFGSIASEVQAVQGMVESATTGVKEDISSGSEVIKEKVRSADESAEQVITKNMQKVRDDTQETASAANEALSGAFERTSDCVESAEKTTAESLATGVTQATGYLDSVSKAAQQTMTSGAQNMQSSTTDTAKSLEDAAAESMHTTKTSIESALATGTQKARDQADAVTTAIDQTVTGGVASIKEKSASAEKAATDAITAGMEDAETCIKDTVQDAKDLKSQVDESFSAAVEDVSKETIETKTQVEEAMTTAGEVTTRIVGGAVSQIKTKAQEADQAISSEVQDAKKEMETVSQDIGGAVQVGVSETASTIDQVDKTLTTGVQGALQQVKTTGEAIDKSSSKAVADAEKQAQKVTSSAIETGRNAAQQAQETAGHLQEGAMEALSTADDQLSSAVKEAEHTVNLGIEKLGQMSHQADKQLSQAAQEAAKTADESVRTATETLSQVGRQASDAMLDAEDAARETAGSVATGVESMVQGVSSGLSEAERGLQAGAEQAAAEASDMAESMYQSAEETLEEANSSVRSTFGGLFGFGRRKSKDTKESKDPKEPEVKDVRESPKAEKKTGGGFFSKMFGRRSPEEPAKLPGDEPKPADADRPSPPEQRREVVEEVVVRRDIHAPREEDRRSSSELSDIREEASGSSSTREPSSPRAPSSLEAAPAGAEGGDPLRRARALDPMTSSLHESFHDVMTGSFHEALQDGDETLGMPGVEFRQPRSPPQSLSPAVNVQDGEPEEPVPGWGPPLGLPLPVPPPDHSGVLTPPPTKRAIMSRARASDSPRGGKLAGPPPVYLDLVYVPHHANSFYSGVQFFHRVRARYYVFSSIEPSREVFNALLEAKQHWEDKDLEVTIIPTYDTDTLGHWFASNEQQLEDLRIDLAPSASRCTINLQDHETSCAAYRLEF